eukprot:351960-Chlamydomonas_euryale.AAC.7
MALTSYRQLSAPLLHAASKRQQWHSHRKGPQSRSTLHVPFLGNARDGGTKRQQCSRDGQQTLQRPRWAQ